MNKQQIRKKQIELGIKTNWKHRLNILLVLLLLVAWWFLIVWSLNNIKAESQEATYIEQKEEILLNTHNQDKKPLEANFKPIKGKQKTGTTEELIREMASKYDVCPETAIRIAKCESQLGKYPINWEGSSAKGVYQFIDKTWDNYCDGDVLNEEDNIRCFMELYNQFSHWWACQ